MIEMSAQNIHLDYGTNAILKGVSMTLKRGEVVSLLGPSGSGKTTLLRTIAGLEQAKQGRILIGDKPVFDAEQKIDVLAEHRNLGLVFQSYALWPHKTVNGNVAYPLQLRKISREQCAQRVQQVLQQLGLGHLGERYPHELSGGQQQRVAIARALVYNPPVILLDEPLSNLDAKLREEARAFLRELIVRLGLSALMVTHDQAEAMAISDRILLLNNGVIVQQGSPQAMYTQPETLFTAEFMGSNNRLEGRVIEIRDRHALLQGAGWQLWGTAGDNVQVGAAAVGIARLEQMQWSEDGQAHNALCAPLIASMFLGERWENLFQLGDAANGARLRALSSQARTAGDYWLHIAPESLWVFGV